MNWFLFPVNEISTIEEDEPTDTIIYHKFLRGC